MVQFPEFALDVKQMILLLCIVEATTVFKAFFHQ